MKYDEVYATQRVALLKFAGTFGMNVVRCGTMRQLAETLPHSKLVVVYFKPMIVTEIQWASKDYPGLLGAEFVGNNEGPTTVSKSIQIGSMSWTAIYRNPTYWKIDKSHIDTRWRGADRKPVLPNYPYYMIETVNKKVVRVQTTGFGFRSLGIENIRDTDFKTVEKELREQALTKRKKHGII